MKKLLLLVVVAATTMPAAGEDKLYTGFQNPPAQARPFVRWWWNGNCPTEKEILRELDVLKEAGIGGVEINPIAMPGGKEQFKDANATPLEWLSPEWNKMVKVACDGAKQRGMIADLIVGSGWPFGGRILQPGEQIQIINLGKKELVGPSVFQSDVNQLMQIPNESRPAGPGTTKRIMFLRLVPAALNDFMPGVDLLNQVKPDGSLRLDIPEGKFILYVGVWRENFREVTSGALGADGPVLDHLNQQAVEKYLNNMSGKLAPALGGKLGDGLRAMFCDSIELSGSNWTTDFSQQFEKRRGYKIETYLPFVLDVNIPKDQSRFYDTVRRARYDFYKTFAELFHERFAQTFHKWCHDNGTLSRYQANGNPWHIDMLNGFMIPDIPEGDGWIVSGEEPFEPQRSTEIHYRVWNKIASSAAHLTGKSIVSCESMTNTIGVFWVTLEYLKESDDLNFLAGVTHSVLHGYNYSPSQVPFPGWVRFGTFFSERNSWWPCFRKWTDRNARLSYLFQNSRHQAKVAIFCPTADLWSDYGLSKSRFVDYIWYLYPMWHALNQNGYSADYVSEKVLQQATFENGKLCFGPQSYEVLIVPDANSMEFKTAQAIRNFAVAGGKIIIVGAIPYRAPAMKPTLDETLKDSLSVQIMIGHLGKTDPNRVARVKPPEKDNLADWARYITRKVGAKPAVLITEPNEKLLHVHYLAEDRDIFFLTSIDRANSIAFRARFDTGDKIPWQWDCETGNRSAFPYGDKPAELDIELGPLQSILLVFEPNMPAKPAKPRPAVDFNNFTEVTTAWQAEFNHYVTGQNFSRPVPTLIDLGAADDNQLNSFAGTITYRTEFEVADTSRPILSLGRVYDISEVALNGKSLGLRWYGSHIYDTQDALKPGKNILEIKVTTTLSNYIRSLKDSKYAMRFASWYPVKPAGLVGPVRLLKQK